MRKTKYRVFYSPLPNLEEYSTKIVEASTLAEAITKFKNSHYRHFSKAFVVAEELGEWVDGK